MEFFFILFMTVAIIFIYINNTLIRHSQQPNFLKLDKKKDIYTWLVDQNVFAPLIILRNENSISSVRYYGFQFLKKE